MYLAGFLKVLDPPPVLYPRGVFPTLVSLFSVPYSHPHIKGAPSQFEGLNLKTKLVVEQTD